MTDRCILFSDLVPLPSGRQKAYTIHNPPGLEMACVEAELRIQEDWFFARRWIPTRHGPRELYRTIDQLEAAGFRFRVHVVPQRSQAVPEPWGEDASRASDLLKGMTEDERQIHRELFPDEATLLARGYDWDGRSVYKDGHALTLDPYRRVLEADEDLLYEWVRVPDECTWRRYPIGRIRLTVTVRGR